MNFLELVLLRRPRLLNLLHRFYLAKPLSQTNEEELAVLSRYAAGKRKGLEIGTHEGVSAARITAAMADGVLYCVDPWPAAKGRENPCLLIAERHLRRSGLWERILILRGFSGQVRHLIPDGLDFVFIDGDHSWEGIKTDWQIVPPKVVRDGIVCLHDTLPPPEEPLRKLDSMRFFREVISQDKGFEVLEQICSLTVLRKR